jgi:cytochrome c biogenesis protein CcmG/thiol:disulfide interchange protein DsbE
LIVALAGIGALLGVFALTIGRETTAGASSHVGRPAPAFSLERLDGGHVTLDELRGRPVVLNFWASWCLPCREEAAMLTKLAADHADRGVVVIGVFYQDDAGSAADFMRRYGQTYPGLLDPSGRTALDYGVFGIPETYFIDADGVIRARQFGPLVAGELEFTMTKILP